VLFVPGPGGQNVNKVATAIHLRFGASSLPDIHRESFEACDQRITKEGVVVIKATVYQKAEEQEALRRLQELIKSVAVLPRKRKNQTDSNSQKNASIAKATRTD